MLSTGYVDNARSGDSTPKRRNFCIIALVMTELFPIRTPVGPLGVVVDAGVLREIRFLERLPSARGATPDPAAQRILERIAAYFEDPEAPFGLPLSPRGTPFQQRVWQAMRAIPPGRVRSYGEIARELGSSPRAVGNACRRNPIPIVVPCHRVVSAGGIGGYAGATGGRKLAIKRWLLAHEGVAL